MSPLRAALFFWTAAVTHAVFWTALPGLFHTGYRPDVIEQLFIGREWVLSSSRHPALPALMLEITNLITGRAFCSPFLVSQVCAVLTFWGIWQLAKKVLNPQLALIPPLSFLLYWFFTLESVKYNQNLPYIAFWTLSITFTFEALRTNKKRYWLLTGICLGLCLFSKFSAILLAGSILFYFIFDSKARKTWRQFGPYLSVATAFLVFLPVLLWVLQQKHLVAPEYISHPDRLSVLTRTYITGRFLLMQTGILALPLLALFPVLRLPLKKRTDRTEEQQEGLRFLGVMIFAPLFLHLLAGLIFLEDMNVDYGAPIWTTFGVWILLLFQTHVVNEKKCCFMQVFAVIIVAEIIYVSAFFVQSCWSPYILNKPRRFHFPMQALGAECAKIWSEHAAGDCPYLSGEWWLAGNAAEGMRPSPSVHAIGAFLDMDFDDSPTAWSTDSDVNQKGGMILWSPLHYKDGTPQTLLKHFPKAVILPPNEISYPNFPNIPPVKVGIAVVLPEK